MSMEDYRDRIAEARDLLELAAQTPEGRQAVKRWTGQVSAALPDEDPGEDPDVLPASEGGTVTWNQNALARSGLTVALSETADGPAVELYPELAGPDPDVHDNGRSDMPQYDAEQVREAYLADEVARLGFMAQDRGPRRPSYAGVQLSEPAARDELDDETLTAATFELAARTGGEVTFAELADAADELALSVSPRSAGSPAARATALAELARRLPAMDAGAEAEAVGLARRREIGRLTGQPWTDPRVADIVARNPDMLSDTPRRMPTHLAVIEDEDPVDRTNPRRGGQVHPEVARILRQHGVLVGFDPSTTTRPKSQAQKDREERRARRGHTNSRYGSWAGG